MIEKLERLAREREAGVSIVRLAGGYWHVVFVWGQTARLCRANGFGYTLALALDEALHDAGWEEPT